MKKLILLTILILSSACISAQQKQTISYDIFTSMSCPSETNTSDDIKQDFIKVKLINNKFYWGDRNTYEVYNKQVRHDGFKTITIYDFVDKYGQRGQLLYQYDESSDWSMRNIFVISYEGGQCMMYLSNDPKKE